MNVDIIIAASIFIIFISYSFLYIMNLNSQGNPLLKSIEMKKQLNDFIGELTSKGNPENWNKMNVIPSTLGISSDVYVIPILVSDNSGVERINEPLVLNLNFDEDCKGIAWNGSVRIYDENFNEIPFKLVNQTFCPSGFLKKAFVFFEANVSSNSSKKFEIFFSNSSSIKLKDYGNFSNLVMYLTLDEGSGNIAYDYSGNNNNGTLYDANSTNYDGNTPPQWVDGKFGKALSFDGIDDIVNVSSSSTLNSPNFTLIAWINLKNLGSGYWSTIFDKEYQYYVGVYSDGHIGFWVGNGNSWINDLQTSPNIISAGNWYHIAIVYNGSMYVYVNGELKAGPKSSSYGINNNPLQLYGRINPAFYNQWANGTLDEVRIYNRALSDQEILSHSKPLNFKIFPAMKSDAIYFEKLEYLKNVSYEVIKEALQKGYNFRIEIYEK